MIRYTKTKLNLFNHYFTHVIGNCIKPNFRPRDKRGTNNNTTRDKLCPLHFSMLFREWSYCFFLLVCKTMAFGVSEIIQNLTLHPRDEERQSKIIARDKPCLLQFNTFFWEVVLLFFFLLVCEILSPVCPPKIFFKNLHIDIQCFIQHKYRLRGQINILHRKLLPRTQVEADTKRTAEVRLSDSMNLSSTKSSNNKERRSSKLLSLRRRPNGSSDARQSQFEFPRQLNVESS